MESQHASSNSELLCKMWLWHSKVNVNNDEENHERPALQCHTGCTSTFDKCINVNKYVPLSAL
jgi:hypothetical protein